MKKRHILLGVTASIAAYKSCEVISGLKKKGHEVTCILTADAERFITRLTLETLTKNKVYKDMFELPEKREAAHVSLADKADLIAIVPATANIIAKAASGLCDDLLACTVISSKKPVLMAPAMNENMYGHAVTQKNIRELQKLGYHFIGPVRGGLACGSVGVGHIAPVEAIVKRIEKILK